MAEIVQGLAKILKIKWKLHSIQPSEFRESRVHESDPQDHFSQALPGNNTPG
jgi:hypothetical protein